MNIEVGGRQRPARFFGPLDQADRSAAEIIEEACKQPIVRMFEAIKIKVIQV